MYKVFFNDRKIVISQKSDITLNLSVKTVEDLHSVRDVKHWFSGFINDDEKEILLRCENPEKFWKDVFVPAFKFIKAAGGVVKRKQQILFIFRNEKWDLPKGKIDKGESAEEAAIREVEEECGITGHLIMKNLLSSYHIYQSPVKKTKNKWILKKTFWFEMHYVGMENGTPQADENITEIKWFKKSELKKVLLNTYENLKQVIALYLD